jgi:hypothetical protein
MWKRLVPSVMLLVFVVAPPSQARKVVLRPSKSAAIVSPSNVRDARSLIRFEAPEDILERGVSIDFAVLKCEAMMTGAPLGQIDVFPLKSVWEDAARVTWDSPWEKPGGDYLIEVGPALYSLPNAPSMRQITIDVTKIVRGWQSGALANHGLILMVSSEDLASYPIACSIDRDGAELVIFYSLGGK